MCSLLSLPHLYFRFLFLLLDGHFVLTTRDFLQIDRLVQVGEQIDLLLHALTTVERRVVVIAITRLLSQIQVRSTSVDVVIQ